MFLDSEYLSMDFGFYTSTFHIRWKLSEIHQLKYKISFPWAAELGRNWVIDLKNDRYLLMEIFEPWLILSQYNLTFRKNRDLEII